MTEQELLEEKARVLEELVRAKEELREKAKASSDPFAMNPLVEAGESAVEGVKTVGKNFVRGALNAAGLAGYVGDALLREPAGLANVQGREPREFGATARAAQDLVNAHVPPPDPNSENIADRLFRAGTESIGGGAVLGPGVFAKAPLQALLSNFAGGAGGELGADAASRFADKDSPAQPWLRGIGALLGGLTAGGGTAWALSPKGNPAKDDLAAAVKATLEKNPGAGADARMFLDKAKDVGASTATLADGFPAGSPIRALGNRAANSTIDNPLRVQMQGRDEDIKNLVQSALEASGPMKSSPAALATKIKELAIARIQQAKETRNKPYTRLQKLPDIPEDEMRKVLEALDQAAKRPGMANIDREALVAIREVLIDPNGPATTKLVRNPRSGVVTLKTPEEGVQIRPEALSLNISGFGERAARTNAVGTAPLSPVAAGRAQQDVSGRIAALPAPWGPEYGTVRAMAAQREDALLDPLLKGPVGKIAGLSPALEQEPALASLSSSLAGRSPKEVRALVQQLERTEKGGTQGWARAVMEQKAANKTAGPGISPREGSLSRESLNMLIDRTGGNSKRFNDALDVAERLGQTAAAEGRKESPIMRAWQAVLRPFRTLDMMAVHRTEANMQDEIGRVLADPKNLDELLRMARTDTSLRKHLATLGITSSVVTQIPDKRRD